MLLYSRDDLYYPLYVYSSFEDIAKQYQSLPENVLHLTITETGGYCTDCVCVKCPVSAECSENTSLFHLFPQVYEDYPELTI